MSKTNVDADLVELMTTFFANERRRRDGAIPTSTTATWDTDLWARLDEVGLARLTGSEESNGSGAGWPEAAELLSAAATHAIRLPLAEHDLLAGWLLERAGLPVGDARRTWCVLGEGGRAVDVPWAPDAERVVVLAQEGRRVRVVDIPTAACAITPGHNLAGEPHGTLTVSLDPGAGADVDPDTLRQVRLRAGLARAIQICAALDRIVELCLEHAGTRTQFGRPIARFQAVQHLVADMACEAALARASTEAALGEAVESDWDSDRLELRVAVARSCAGHAVSPIVRHAHQVHGAMGTTQEHPLHEYTLSALAWRHEYGSVRHWDDVVTEIALSSPHLWSALA